MKFDVIIVGAGPAGLFAAIELNLKKPSLNIVLIEKGKRVKERSDIMCGVGGSGTFSDGKLHFSPVLSHGKLFEWYSEKEVEELCDYIDKIFTDFGVNAEYFPKDKEKTEELVAFCRKQGVNLIPRRLRHVGSDILPKIIENIENYLINKKINIYTETTVQDIIIENNQIIGVTTDKGDMFADYIIMAPGRVNAVWMQKLASFHGLQYNFEEAEVGVRVEFPSSVMKEYSDLMYEAIFLIHTDTFDDVVRTFCPCPNGFVATEDYEGYKCVNGHSNSNHNSENSNFALLSKVNLTEPVTNSISYAKSIAQLANTIGGGKPIIQRFKDLKRARRSTWKRISKSYVNPSLKEVTPGDLSMALPYRVVKNIIEGLEKLGKVMPGIDSDETLLYGPEIKLRTSKIKTNKLMETEIKNLFVAGDGPGVSGNITGAAVTGVLAARGILAKPF